MSSSTGREQLKKNAGGTSTAFIDNQSGIDLFQYPNPSASWTKSKNYVEEKINYVANSSTHTRGSSSVIEIDKRQDAIGAMHLMFDRALFTGTSVCPVDWEPYYQIKEIQFSYGNKVFWKTDGERLVFDIFEKDDARKRKGKARMASGDLLPRERILSGSIAQRFIVDLSVPWRKLQKQIPIVALPNKIRVEIFWRPLSEMCTSASAALFPPPGTLTAETPGGGAITNVELIVRSFHYPEFLRDALFEKVSSTPLILKFLAYQRHPREALTSATTANSIRLTNFTLDSIEIKSYIRQLENVTSTEYLNPYKTLPFVSALRDNGIIVTNYFNSNTHNNNSAQVDGNMRSWQASDVYNKWYREVKQNPSVSLDTRHPVNKIPLVLDEYNVASEDNSFGSRNLSLYNALELYIDPTVQLGAVTAIAKAATSEHDIINSKQIWGPFGLHTANSSSFYVDVWSIFHNVLIIGKGDIKSWLSW